MDIIDAEGNIIEFVFLVKNRKEYEDILESACKIAEIYGRVSVSDLFDLAGLDTTHMNLADCGRGWDLRMLKSCYGKWSSNTPDEYLMILPDPKPLDELKKEPDTRIFHFKTEMVNHPSHYQSTGGIEVIDVIKAFTADLKGVEAFDTGNVIKYICRWKNKNGIEDLKKAAWYINDLINILEEESNK